MVGSCPGTIISHSGLATISEAQGASKPSTHWWLLALGCRVQRESGGQGESGGGGQGVLSFVPLNWDLQDRQQQTQQLGWFLIVKQTRSCHFALL